MEPSRDVKGRPSLFNKVALLMIVLILGVALFGEKGVVRLVKLMREREALSSEVEQLKVENDRLRHEIEALRNDQDYLEHLARKQLGMVRKDELVYQFRPGNQSTTEESAPAGDGH